MNKTLYVKDEDALIWDRARELTGDKISQFILEKLRAFVAEQEGKRQGFERITLRYVERGTPKATAFVGRWLISPDAPWVEEWESDDFPNYAVAVTAKNNVVVFNFVAHLQDGEFGPSTFEVYNSFEHASGHDGEGAIEAAMRRQGIEVQELDI